MKIRPARLVHEDTITAKQKIWLEFGDYVAEEIEKARGQGRFMARITVRDDVSDAAPMVDILKGMGYTAHISKGDSNDKLIVCWRTPKGEVA